MSIKKGRSPRFTPPKGARARQDRLVEEGQEGGLLRFLVSNGFPERSRTTLKQLLSDRYITVNGESVTKWDHPLAQGDKVSLNPTPIPAHLHHKQVEILWQDEHLVMVHKGVGVPTVSSGEERDKTLLQIVSAHLKKFDPRAKVFLLNRIDKDCSGFVLLAKTEKLQEQMTKEWHRYVIRQQFALAVEGGEFDTEGYLQPPSSDATNTRNKNSRSTEGAISAGYARYRRLAVGAQGILLSVELLAGRNNRLRRQLALLKCPIVGDWRNGSQRKDIGRVALESMKFSFVHPINGKQYDFEQPIPRLFRQWIK